CECAKCACRSKLLRKAKVESAPGPELRREHADAGAVAEFMDAVEDIDHIEPYRRRLALAVPFEFMGDAGIDLGEKRKWVGVGKAASQAAAVDHSGAEASAVPKIGHASRPHPNLGVVRIDVVRGDVSQLVGIE